MKDKKGIMWLPIIGIFYLVFAIILVLVLWWVLKGIDFSWFSELLAFWRKWWWAIGLSFFALTPVGQGVIRWTLGKVGIRV